MIFKFIKKKLKYYKYLYILILIFSSSAYSQINNEIPTIIEPSPDISKIINFQETSVDNYSGNPNISIPLLNLKVKNNLNLDLALIYNINDVKVNSIPSVIGSGWSLMSNGFVSRTVNDLPDDINFSNKRGILSTINPFFEYFTESSNEFILPSNHNSNSLQNFVWDKTFKGMYDTEYDTYNYSFLGESGKFIIRKGRDNLLYAFSLTPNSNVKINIIHDHDFIINSFEIYNDLGIKFIFEDLEYSQIINRTLIEHRGNNFPDSQPEVFDHSFRSSYNLSRIIDENDNAIVNYQYEIKGESTENKAKTFYSDNQVPDSTIEQFLYSVQRFININDYNWSVKNSVPLNTTTINTIGYSSKKVKSINIVNKGTVTFNYVDDREDYKEGGTRLNEIILKDNYNNIIKNINFSQEYSGVAKRLVLNNVNFVTPEKTNTYNIEYNAINLLPELDSDKKDFYGNYNGNEDIRFRDVVPQYLKYGSIKKITLPTGGDIEYEFEPNTYSYTGNTLVTNDFIVDENKTTKTFSENYIGYDSENINSYKYFEFNQDQTINLIYKVTEFRENRLNENINYDKSGWSFKIIPVESQTPMGEDNLIFNYLSSYNIDSTRQIIDFDMHSIDNTLNSDVYNLSAFIKKGAYIVKFYQTNNLAAFSVKYNLSFKYSTYSDTYKYRYAGGLRIKKILYKYDNNNVKTFNYSYNNPNDIYTSSGSLNSFLPKFKYLKNIFFLSKTTVNGVSTFDQFSRFFEIENVDNIFNSIYNNGNSVGYKHIKIEEQNNSLTNGYTLFEYTNAIDFPERNYTLLAPSVTDNYDYSYKRGLILNQKIFNSNNALLKSINYEYSMDNEIVYNYGIRFYNKETCAFFKVYNSYDEYRTVTFGNNCGEITSHIEFYKPKTAIGWAKLTNVTTSEYFNNNHIIIKEEFGYNFLNKKQNFIKKTFPNNETETLSINFLSVNSPKNIISLINSESLQKDNFTVLKQKKIYYNDSWDQTNSTLASKVTMFKNQNENITYLINDYDDFNNILEIQLNEDGLKTSYIYGYEKTLPVAKLENVAYASINQDLITQIQNTTNEDELLSLFNTLRNNHPQGLITTYIHIPLVGISKVIDPNGKVINYYYDEFNRLSRVTDSENNPVTDYEYHYKTL